jgi:hypothetical protein
MGSGISPSRPSNLCSLLDHLKLSSKDNSFVQGDSDNNSDGSSLIEKHNINPSDCRQITKSKV